MYSGGNAKSLIISHVVLSLCCQKLRVGSKPVLRRLDLVGLLVSLDADASTGATNYTVLHTRGKTKPNSQVWNYLVLFGIVVARAEEVPIPLQGRVYMLSP